MQLQDGTGKGYWVQVDSYNRLRVYATLKPEISDISINKERAYSVTTPVNTFNSTNEHPFLWIRNNDPNLILFFSSIIYSYNGGDINHNRVAIKRVYSDCPEPTDRYTEVTPVNLNIGSPATNQFSVYTWNGTGDGMEVDIPSSNSLSTSMIPNSSVVLNEVEAVSLGYRAAILFTYEPEEIGKAALSTKLYFNNE